MFSNIKIISQAAGAAVTQMIDRLNLVGKYTIDLIRAGAIIASVVFTNTVVNEGKNRLFDVMFNGATQITAWYAALMDNTGYASSPATDTAASHAGWTEFVGYSEATRPEWAADAAASQQITNTTASVFTINAAGTLRGIFIASVNTKNASTGVLWSTALFPAALPVTNGDQIKITYTVAA